jgi:chromosome partitioning protein
MQTIMIYNEKGGVGKTTLSAQIGAVLATLGNQVLLIDADPQAHLTLTMKQSKRPFLYNLIIRDEENGGAWNKCLSLIQPERYEPANQESKGALYLVNGNAETASIAGNVSDAFALHSKLEEVEDTFDFVIIDTAPTRSAFHAMLYYASDHIIIPTQLEALSFDGIKQTMDNLATFSNQRKMMGYGEINTLAIIPNMYRTKTGLHKENLQRLKSAFGDKVTKPIPLTILWGELTQTSLASIFAYQPESKIAKLTWNIGRLIAEKVAINE